MSENYIAKNLAAVRAEMRAAEANAKRPEAALIAAVKYATDEQLAALLAAGVTDVGENRVQQLLAHLPIYEKTPVRVHFIGTLQKNKIKYIIDKVYAVHSVDSIALAKEIDKHAQKRGICLRVYAEVNSGREAAKSGVMPEEALALCREITQLQGLSLQGLMTMAPRQERAEDYRRYFKETRELAGAIWQELALDGEPLLSMGMSESFVPAILEGAHSVRVGRRLFAGAPPQGEENTD